MFRLLAAQGKGIKGTEELRFSLKDISRKCGPISTNTLELAVDLEVAVCSIPSRLWERQRWCS